nr:phage major capsid protein [uncultured Romboutsia sp.]
MKKLVELRNDYLTEIETILATAEQEGRVLTEEEIARLKELKAETEKVDADMKAVEEARALTIVEEKEEKLEEESEKRDMNMEIREQEMNAFAEVLRTGEMRALTTSANGAVIPTTVADEIVMKMRAKSSILDKATIYNEIGQLKIVKGEEFVADYVDENTDLSETDKPITAIVLDNFTIGALVVVSKSLINMTNLDIVDYVTSQIANALVNKVEKELLVGTPSKIDGCSKTTNTANIQEEFTLADLIKVQAKAIGTRAEDCIWVASREVFESLASKVDAIGRPYMVQGFDTTGAVVNKLLGAKVEVSDALEGKALYYGDFSGLAVKISQKAEVQVLKEKFATKNALGVVGFIGVDAKVQSDEKIVKVTVAGARKR